MNDDAHDPLTPDEDLLAVSALLDGTATADDRARVDADPALQQLVDTLRVQRTDLADVQVPDRARERALGAAMAVFDGLQAPTPSHLPTNVIRFERRRRSYRLLTGAAAAVGVLFVGALAIGALGSMGGDDEESASVASDPSAKAASPAPAGVNAVDDPATPMMESAAADSTSAGASAGAFDTQLPAATESAAAPTEAPEATEAPASQDGIDSIDQAAELEVTIATPQQLLDYANTKQPILALPGLPFPCVADGLEAVGEVRYRGVQVIVVRNPATGEVNAFDIQDECALIATVAP